MIRTQSVNEECYSDRNLLVQLYACELMKHGTTVFLDEDDTTPDYMVLCIEITDNEQLSWHIPKCEIILNVKQEKGRWIPTDVSLRRIFMVNQINRFSHSQ